MLVWVVAVAACTTVPAGFDSHGCGRVLVQLELVQGLLRTGYSSLAEVLWGSCRAATIAVSGVWGS